MPGRPLCASAREVLEDWSQSLSPSVLVERLTNEYYIDLLPAEELGVQAIGYDYSRNQDDLAKAERLVASREELAAVGAANQEAKDRVRESLQIALANASGASYYHELYEKRLA